MQLQTTSPESKFPNEYSDVIFIQIDQHLKKLLQKYKGSRFYETRCISICDPLNEVMFSVFLIFSLSVCIGIY